MDDEQILALYFARAENAIAETGRRYGRYCASIAMSFLQSRADAEECVNDTYLAAWNAIPPARPSALSAFLGRITRNLSINRLRAKQTQKRGGGTVDALLDELAECLPSRETVEQALADKAVAEAINTFLRTLDGVARRLFVRRYWYADSLRDAAARLGLRESTAKSMLFRTREKLRAYLEKEGISV